MECTVKALEEGAGTLTFASGMSAVTTAILGVCKTGDHIVSKIKTSNLCLTVCSILHNLHTSMGPTEAYQSTFFQIAQNPIYSGTHKFLTKYAADYGYEVTMVSADDGVEAYRKHLKHNTKVYTTIVINI